MKLASGLEVAGLVTHTTGKWKITSVTDDEYIGPLLSQGIEWESWMRQDIQYAYKPGTDILDIGGNIGCNALMFSDYGPVHTFEPMLYDILEMNVKQNNLVHPVKVYPFGLSSSVSNSCVHITKTYDGLRNYGGFSMHPDHNHSDTTYPISLHTLDDVYKGTPSVVKIDVEGHEMDVLKGADVTLRTYKPAIIIEIHDFNNSKIPDYLKNLGYGAVISRPCANYLFLKD